MADAEKYSAGAGLNFSVVGGLTQPSGPKENTIWVNTDQKITGWYFSAAQPENMKEGEVWFLIGTSSTVKFNALKKNNVTVYPLSVKQYINGAWVEKTAKIYQGGEWVDLNTRLYIFQEGKGVMNNYTVKATLGNGFAVTTDGIIIGTDSDYGNQIWVEPTIDMTQYKHLVVELTGTDRYSSNNSIKIGVGSDKPSGENTPGDFAAYLSNIYSTMREMYKVPISTVNQELYIKIASYGVVGYIYNIWLE